MPLVELDSVHKRYRDGPPALDGVSLAVDEGRVLVLLGTSGAGKTTALKLVNRLLTPDSGRVVVFGEDAARADPIALRRRIGYVIQEVGLLPHLSVAENVSLVPRLLGSGRTVIRMTMFLAAAFYCWGAATIAELLPEIFAVVMGATLFGLWFVWTTMHHVFFSDLVDALKARLAPVDKE